MSEDSGLCFEGVRPDQTNHKLMRAWLSKGNKHQVHLIQSDLTKTETKEDYVHFPSSQSTTTVITCSKEKQQEHLLHLPSSIFSVDDRTLGHPLCIGANSRYALLQFVNVRNKFVHFLLVDLWNNCPLIVFTDPTKYFHWSNPDVVAPLECIMSPYVPCSSTCIQWILRLPPVILRLHIWSKMFLFQYSGSFQFKSYRDRRFQAVTYNSTGTQLALLGTDDTCMQGSVTVLNASSLQEDGHLLFNLHSEQLTTVPFIVRQSMIAFNNAGDRIVAVVLVAGSPTYRVNVYVISFESPRLSLLEICTHWCDHHEQPTRSPGMCSFSFNSTDHILEIWWWAMGSRNGKPLCSYSLRREIKLVEQCRRVVLQCVSLRDLDRLPVPSKILTYLKFGA